ncbi:proline/glycine betaine ABC transporter ATPase [Mycobacteroides abscessus subsp. abscessus]|nr:proline/glycine betaine ABC transporter ATPase [Mycobacteroides abscessus subsp. abscessus]
MTDTATPTAAPAVSGVEIVLDAVTKRYPGHPEPAVDEVSMTIPAGQIVVLVGPSGCGKTRSPSAAATPSPWTPIGCAAASATRSSRPDCSRT